MGEIVLLVGLLCIGMVALSYRSRWREEREAREQAQAENAKVHSDNQKLLEECTRLTGRVSELGNTLAQLKPAKDPQPVRARTSAEARRIVEQRNTEELNGNDRDSEDAVRQ